jgi:hypothetical protein
VVEDVKQKILLQTTPAENIPTYIAANSRCRDCNQIVIIPDCDQDLGQCQCEAPNQLPVFGVQKEYTGKTVAICGAGPSLREAYKAIRKADHVWGCNRAAHWLVKKNWKITHGFAIDSSPAMFEDAWKEPPGVDDFILATSVDPRLTDHLLEHGKRVRFFHSVRGKVDDEFKLYALMYQPAPVCGRGLNVVNRAVDLARFLDYRRIYVCGADNALGRAGDMYANLADETRHAAQCRRPGTTQETVTR